MFKKIAKWILKDEISEFEDKIKKYCNDCKLYYPLDNNIYQWHKIKSLIEQNCFKTLCRFWLDDIELQEQEIASSDPTSKFWYCQGAKFVLHEFLKFEERVKEKILFFARKKEQTEAKETKEQSTPNYT